MVARPRADRETRRAELAATAARVFAEKGVAGTAVSDIVRAAGVAQGTFYLYFESKDDVVLAVVDMLVARLTSAIEQAAYRPEASAVTRLLGLRDALSGFGDDPAALELADFVHRPENRAIHDRLAEQLVPQLLPLARSIVQQGVEEGFFDVPDIDSAAWFVLAGLQSAELAGTAAADMPGAIQAATVLCLRALGCTEVRS